MAGHAPHDKGFTGSSRVTRCRRIAGEALASGGETAMRGPDGHRIRGACRGSASQWHSSGVLRRHCPAALRELRRLLCRRDSAVAGRAALPGFRRPRADRRPLSRGHLALPAGTEGRRHLVLQRLSRHGAAPQGRRGDGRCGEQIGDRRRRHAQHFRHQPPVGPTRGRTRRSPRQGGGAGLHVRLRIEPDRHLDHCQAHSRLSDPVRCAQPQFDDRGNPSVRNGEAHFSSQ